MSESNNLSSQLDSNITVRKRKTTQIVNVEKDDSLFEFRSVTSSPVLSSSDGDSTSDTTIDNQSLTEAIVDPLRDAEEEITSISTRLEKIIVTDQGTSEDSISERIDKINTTKTESPTIEASSVISPAKLIIMSGSDEWNKLFNQQDTLRDDIADHIQEYMFDNESDIEEINESISKLEGIRSRFRGFHKELRTLDSSKYDSEVKEEFEECLLSIKTYLNTVKLVKSDIRSVETAEKSQIDFVCKEKKHEDEERKMSTAKFLLTDVQRMIKNLKADL